MTRALHDPEQAMEQLGRLPGGAELLAQSRVREDIALIGGAVRDLLLGHWPRELDVTVARDSAGLASALAASISPSERPYGHAVEPILHERFGTASVVWDYGRIDIAELRTESYPAPGALPVVREGTVEQDLARRDFTLNAIALPLGGAGRGGLAAVEHALEDLAEGRLRVLHDQSFLDDPTRLLRLARYSGRLGFEVERHTAELAARALAANALRSVSGARIGTELWLAVREPEPFGSLTKLGELGVLKALGLPAVFDSDLAGRALQLLPADGRRDELLMAVLFHAPVPLPRSEGGELMEGLAFPADVREKVLTAAFDAASMESDLRGQVQPSRIRDVFAGAPVEAVALAGALGAEQAAVRWLKELRHVQLRITGDDLLSAGVPQGPQIGARLAHALERKLDGEIPDEAEAELRAALGMEQ